MAHHKSAIKRIRQTRTRKLYNRLNKKSLKLALRSVRESKSYDDGMQMLTKAYSVLDKVVAHGVIHKNYASNRKKALSAFVKKMKIA